MSECNSSRNSQDGYDETAVVEIRGDQAENDSAAGRLHLNSVHMWALGVCIAVSGTYYAWNVGLAAGFGSYVIARVFVSSAYVFLILSISELSSGLPFAGGAYGIARVTLGPFAGYMVACYESMETVVACAALIFSFAKGVVTAADIDVTWEPYIWALFYIVYIAFHSWGGRMFWNAIMVLAIGNLILAVIFLLGSAKYANFAENAAWPDAPSEHQVWFRGGLFIFMRYVPSACNGFTCIECVNLACKDVQNPKRDIPRGFVASVLTQAAFCLAAVFVCASLAPGIVAASKAGAPFTIGYMAIFNCTAKQASVLSLPALCAAAFGRMFSYGRQISAMGRSGMINPFFGQELPQRHTPFYGLVLGGVLGYGCCLISYFEHSVQLVQMTQMALLGAYTSYFAQLTSFIMFQGTFSIIKREFVSPLGIPGAVYSMFWFLLCFISVAFFQDNHFAITGYAVYTVAVLIYYYTVVQYRQFFSDEEKAILFRAHLVKNNTHRAAKLRKGRYSVSSGASANASVSLTHNHAAPVNGSPHSISLNSSSITNNTYSGSPRRSMQGGQGGTPKHGSGRKFQKASTMGSLSEAIAEAGTDLRRFSQASVSIDGLIPPPADEGSAINNCGNNSESTKIEENCANLSPRQQQAPQESKVLTTQEKIEKPKPISRAYSLLSGLSSGVAAVGATFMGDYERVHVSPHKQEEEEVSIDDIEANTFRGSVRVKPTSSVRIPALRVREKSSDRTELTLTEDTSTTAATSAATTATSSGIMLTPINTKLSLGTSTSALALQNPADLLLANEEDSSIS